MTILTVPDYTYENAKILKWVDGDTVDLQITVTTDIGFGVVNTSLICERFRLYGINTPERGQPYYSEATAFAESQAPVGSIVTAKTYKAKEKYGRYLVEIYVGTEHVNEALVASGLAVPYFGGTK